MGALAELAGGTHVVVLSPRSKSTAAEVRDVVERELVARVGAGPFRAGNVQRVEAFVDAAHEDRLVVLFSVDIGTSPSLRDALATIEAVARVRIVATSAGAVLRAP